MATLNFSYDINLDEMLLALPAGEERERATIALDDMRV